ncbi:MAG TPA: TrmH family RNA methyltransferase [Acidobacteriaceae bacterium]|jgi:tRNA/rRNA methyltransferase|nr:TrmH family RNA methyltransferase [Acidobacteriaceae bacterium]
MLSAAARARLTVVLVGARNPGNIGAAARAMRDFGFGDLRVVNVYAPPFEAAQIQGAGQIEGARAAVGAAPVLAAARRFDRLEEAIADCTLVAGTTAIGERELTRPVLRLSEAVPRMLQALAVEDVERSGERRVALLFGSEKTGLTNEQLSHCQLLLTIPMFAPEGERHLSMNLGQAVAVCLYELARAGFEGARELPERPETDVTAAARERLTKLLLDAMAASGYARRFPANAREHMVRKLAQQLGGSEEEATTWMGFLRQVVRSAEKAREADEPD